MSSNQINYFSKYPYAELNSQDGLFCFKICTYNYAYPNADNEHDADWHRNYLYLTIPAFRVEINEVMLEGRVLEYYLHEFEKFLALKKKEVIFEPTESYFGLTFSLKKFRKKVNVNGYVQYPVGHGSELQFEFETDLTYIEKFVNGLKEIIRHFPVKK